MSTVKDDLLKEALKKQYVRKYVIGIVGFVSKQCRFDPPSSIRQDTHILDTVLEKSTSIAHLGGNWDKMISCFLCPRLLGLRTPVEQTYATHSFSIEIRYD